MTQKQLCLISFTLLVFLLALLGCAGSGKDNKAESGAAEESSPGAAAMPPEAPVNFGEETKQETKIEPVRAESPQKAKKQSKRAKKATTTTEQVKIEGQYLRVKFKQNDTEVDLVLDPGATNLALDLQRGPDGFLEVTRGDSTIFDTDAKRAEELVDQLGDLGEGSGLEHLTDDIIRDISDAQKLFYQQRYDDAINVLKASLQKKPTATAYALGGSIYYVNGDIVQAVRAWESALKLNPEMDEVRDLLVRYKNVR
jgi:tetratricopeptide (TPR) repeat protein